MAKTIPVLRRVDIVVLKDKNPPSDFAQVPAGNVPVDFYAQGATYNGTADIVIIAGGTGSVPVYHVGTLQASVGETVQVDTDAAAILEVLTIAVPADGSPGGSVSVKNNGSVTVTVRAGNRLVRRDERPEIYDDPAGVTGTGLSQRSTDGNGRLRCYLNVYRFDYIIVIDASTKRIYVDAAAPQW